jgi:hypothetical protein
MIAESTSTFPQAVKPTRDMQRILIITLLTAVLLPMSVAQVRGGMARAAGGGRLGHFRRGGFGYPYFYSDFGDGSAEVALPPPNFVDKRIVEPERLAQPLLIEWHGDHFVRYGGAQAAVQSSDYAEVASGAPLIKPGASSHAIPPAVLIYRDGHREEVSDYVITRGVLYARGDGYSQASRSIQLSALDLSATFKANQDSGARFVLPETLNDVVTRP